MLGSLGRDRRGRTPAIPGGLVCVWWGGRVVLSRRLSRPVQQGKGLGEMAFEIPSDCIFLLPLSSALGLGLVTMTTLSQGGQLLLMKG